MKKLLLILLFLSLSGGKVYATTQTGYIYPSGVGYYGGWGAFTLSLLQADDNNFVEFGVTPIQPTRQSLKFDTTALYGKKISRIDLQTEVKQKYDNTSSNVTWYHKYANDALPGYLSATDKISMRSTGYSKVWLAWNYYWADSPGFPDVTDWFKLHPMDSEYTVVFEQSMSGAYTNLLDIDYVRIAYTWDEPDTSVSIIAQTTDPVDQSVILTLTGDTVVKGAELTGKVRIYESCTNGALSLDPTDPVATILLDPFYTGTTTAIITPAPNTYMAYGWSPTSSVWHADGVRVPYHQGYICTYRWNTEVIDTTDPNNPVVVKDEDYIGGQSDQTAELTPPEPTDPLAWLAWKLGEVIKSIFALNMSELNDNITTLNNTIKTKVPFAYFYALGDLDLSPVDENQAFAMDFPVFMTAGTPTFLNVSIPAQFDSVFSGFKNVMRISLYGSFIYYLFRLARRII